MEGRQLINKGFKFLGALFIVAVLQGRLAFPDKHNTAQNQERAAPGEADVDSGTEGLEFLGEIIPDPQLVAEVVAPLWGKIYLEEGVHLGAKVEKGQELARVVFELDSVERLSLNDRTIEIERFLDTARNKALIAWNDYQRAMEISKSHPDFKAEMARRKQVYDNALKEFQLVDQQSQRQTVVIQQRDPRTIVVNSPLSGYIQDIYFVPGDINAFGEFRKLFTIVNLSTVWVQAEVFEKDFVALQDSPAAMIHTLSDPGQTFHGRLQAFGSEIDARSRTIPVFYEIQNPGEKLRLGVRVRLKPVSETF